MWPLINSYNDDENNNSTTFSFDNKLLLLFTDKFINI